MIITAYILYKLCHLCPSLAHVGRRRFGSLLDIIPIADSVTKLNARCELCDKRALFTLRKTGETKTELIAGADVYMPVCRKHYVSGQVVKETTRTILEKQKDQCGSLLS